MGKQQKIKATRQAERQEAVAIRERRRRRIGRIIVGVVGLVVLAAAGFGIVAATKKKAAAPAASAVPSSQTTNQTEANVSKKTMTIETSKGTIVVELNAEKAPKTVAQISTLISRSFYDGLSFHRVEPGFVIQGGDPKGDGTGGSDLPNIPFETNDLKHDKGVIAMARSQDKNSANSQFYITIGDAHFLDGNYVAFGKVVSGLEVAEKIQKGDKMTKVTLQ